MRDWRAMIVTTAQFASRSNKSLHNRIVEYAKAGGIFIFGGMFSNTIRPTVFYNFLNNLVLAMEIRRLQSYHIRIEPVALGGIA